MFLTIFDKRSSIVKMFSIAAYPVCYLWTHAREVNFLPRILLKMHMVVLFCCHADGYIASMNPVEYCTTFIFCIFYVAVYF